MKHIQIKTIASAALMLSATFTQAFTYVSGDVNAGGVGYAGYVTVGATDSGSISNHVGAWSWEDQGIAPGGGEGWTHTSNWIALDVTADTWLTLALSRDAGVPYLGSGNVGGFAAIDHMFPSFTIWRNWDNDDLDDHTYNNTGAVAWAEDLTYLDHTANSTLSSVSDSWFLTAGQYTIVMGSNSPSISNPPRQGYSASFSTSPVPEPGRVTFLALAGLGLFARRRRS